MSYRDPYHDKPGVSSHMLSDFRVRGPLYYYRKHVQKVIKDSDSDAYALGRGFHALTLEGQGTFDSRFIVAPPEHLTPGGELSTKKDTKAWLSEQANVDVLSPGEASTIRSMAKAVAANASANRLLSVGAAEVEQFATHRTGLALKGKADWCTARGEGIDLKSCWSVDEFPADALKYCYAEQMAFYRSLFDWSSAYLIACEKQEPFRVRVFRLTDSCLNAARERNEVALSALAACKDEDCWHDRADVIDLDLSIA